MYDDNTDEEAGRYATYKPPPPQLGDPGYRLGVWTNEYDPGPNWNNGQHPDGATGWNMDTNEWNMPAAPAPKPAAAPQADNRPAAPQPQFQAPQAAPAPAPEATPSSYTPAPAAIQKPAITDDVTRILQSRLKELSNPSDVASDPIYQQAVRAYQVGQLRDADRQRKALAERTAATSGTTSSGGFNVGARRIQEQAGENSSRYRSGLAMDRLSAREDQLNKAISAARAVGQDDIANQLELQRLQLQSELGRGDLALRSQLGLGNLNLGYDNLGLNYAQLVQNANRDATLAGLRV